MLIHLLVLLLVFGVVAALINILPIDAQFKQLAYIVLVVIAILSLLGDFFWWGPTYRTVP